MSTGEVNRQTEDPGYGRLLSEHRVSRRRQLLTLGAAVGLAAAGILGLPLTFAVNAPGSGSVTIVGCLGMSLLAVAAGWWSRRVWQRERSLAVHLYQHGLTCQDGNKRVAMRWDDVWSVTMSWPVAGGMGPGDVILETADKKRLVLHDPAVRLEATPLLAQTIQQEVARRLMPKVQQAFEAGRWLGFRRMRISRSGLQREDQTVPWEAIERIEIAGGTVTVHHRGRWRRWLEVPVEEIPNLLVFARLAEHHTDLNWQG